MVHIYIYTYIHIYGDSRGIGTCGVCCCRPLGRKVSRVVCNRCMQIYVYIFSLSWHRRVREHCLLHLFWCQTVLLSTKKWNPSIVIHTPLPRYLYLKRRMKNEVNELLCEEKRVGVGCVYGRLARKSQSHVFV